MEERKNIFIEGKMPWIFWFFTPVYNLKKNKIKISGVTL